MSNEASEETVDQQYPTAAEILTKYWRVAEDDQIGGWCIVLEDDTRSPANGAHPISNFVHRDVAAYIVKLHNFDLYTSGMHRTRTGRINAKN